MKLTVKTLPTFTVEATKLATSRAGDLLGSLTIEEAEICIKTWVLEAVLEVQEPDEKSVLYFTRSDTAKELGVTVPTIDSWVEKGLLTYRWLGKRKVFLQSDLQKVLSDTNFYNQK